ncbi:MAG: T9SS type A sorting domain-containing protein [Bacteroidales bacterium]|nr:T9SS type A sorting domain-containing protein [Bacteroidales bacterium]
MRKVLCVFFAFTFILISSTFSQTKKSGDIIAYWKMDGNLIDELGNYDWTNYGAIPNNNGMFNECYEFNNGTTGKYCEAPSVSLHDEASISCWIYFYPDQMFDGGIILKTHGSPHGDQTVFGFQTGNNQIIFTVTHNSSNSNHTNLQVPYNVNTWYHLVGVFDGPNEELRVYLNTVKYVEESNGDVIYNPNTKLKMGMQKYASRSFRGKLDEIRLFDKALTDSEVEELFNMTNIANMDLINEISLYPNPCEDKLHIEGLTGQYNTILYNVNGQILYEKTVNKHNNSINTSKLKKGVYFLRLFDKERIVIKKVIKN